MKSTFRCLIDASLHRAYHVIEKVHFVDMQLTYAPRTFATERSSWRAVIQLNLVRSINTIIDAVCSELSPVATSSSSSYLYHSNSISKPPSPVPADTANSDNILDIPQDRRAALMKLKLRLAPLRQVEADLKARLGAGTEEITEATLSTLGTVQEERASSGSADDAALSYTPSRKLNPKEVFVRSNNDWKEKEKARAKFPLASLSHSNRSVSSGYSQDNDRDTATDVLAGCAEDMVLLWQDQHVREIVKRRRVMSGLWDSAD